MKIGDLLLVYGTLRTGESNDLSRFDDSTPAGKTRINGRLYNLGWFPGVKLDTDMPGFSKDSPTVTGDVFSIGSAKLVERLDSYEGYPSLYSRSQVDTEDGRTVWVYTYNGNVAEDSRVESGDWCDSSASRCSARKAAEPVNNTATAPVAA